MKLILFDIDGTLVRCGRQVRPLFIGALEATFGGYSIPDSFNFAGKTDPMIIAEMVRSVGLPEHEVKARLPSMQSLYEQRLRNGLVKDQMRLLPGVVELLDRLTARGDVQIGLLTGNFSGGAEAKLTPFDLWRHFPFGAFGEDAADRRGLVPVALERARDLTGRAFAAADTLIVGDTALDVDCARAAGARSLAVATGFTDAQELHDSGADWVYDDLLAAIDDFELFAPAAASVPR